MEGGIAFVGYTTSYGVANKDAMLVYLRYDSPITTLDYDIVIYIEQLSPIGIDEISTDSDIFLFPNPASDKVTINSGFDKEVSTLMIYDYSGRQLHVQLDNQSKTFSTNGLSSGIYLLKITMDDGRMYSAKLTILH